MSWEGSTAELCSSGAVGMGWHLELPLTPHTQCSPHLPEPHKTKPQGLGLEKLIRSERYSQETEILF